MVEGYEIRAVLFGGCGDQGVCETGAVAPSVISPVEPANPAYPFCHGQDDECQEKQFQGLLLFVAPDAGEQLCDGDHRYVEVRRQALQVLRGFASSAEVFDQHVSVYEQPPSHALPLYESFATLVELPAQPLEVGQVVAVFPHAPRTAK